ncbi:hypothetical protein BC835DRAFT_403343 [Cytidiella melzeri]|nr:hypothetical protein BC835DRAFT_403343 [Cytidiella melzeri]
MSHPSMTTATSVPSAPENRHEEWDCSLDDQYYDPDPEALAFYQKETGIEDDAELKQHILTVQKEAFSIYNYPCIRVFEFMRLKLARLPAYDQVLRLGRERENALLLDLGCCFGNDTRKVIQDGYPKHNVMASDLRKGLWDLGHKLFCSTPQSFPVAFVEGNIFDPEFLTSAPPLATSTSVYADLRPDLASLTSLNPLRGRMSVIFTGALFHLFSFEQQHSIAKSLAGLLSPDPGSMLIGVQGGTFEKGFWQPTGSEYKMACHSPESWAQMWHDIFSNGEGGDGGVKVEAKLRTEVGGLDFFGMFAENKNQYHVLEWSVIRK